MNPADEMAAKPDAPGSGEKSDQQLRALLENLQRVQGNPVEQDHLHSGFTPYYLDQEASQRKAIYDRLVAIENAMKKRGSRRFARYLVAILIGVAATLSWQSYGDATKQIIATKAPELGWSPGTKQMIAGWMQQLGWTKPLAVESKAAPVAQTAPETVAPKAPAVPSIDPAQVQQIARDLATLRLTVEQLAAGQAKLEAADVEILAKINPAPPPPPPIAAPARKPTVPPPSSRAPIPPHP